MLILFWLCILLVIYVYAGYPLLLLVLRWVRRKAIAANDGYEPHVTLIISAYNEQTVIGKKIENSLVLQYPAEKLEIIVVSDCSTDGTDEIVSACPDRRVKLLRMPQRGGKTAGLNAAVPQAKGEIVIFSDANALYAPLAVRKIVRNFADPAVGAVTGESRYTIGDGDTSTESENLYWRYELALKKLESHVSSLVGGDGAIYAIRRDLYEPLQAEDLSDFVNPLQIVAKGYRNVYEQEAVSYEGGGESFDKEFRRKVRIVNRAWRGLMRVPRVLNPFRFGLFAVQVISHKLLRWLVPVFMLFALFSNFFLLAVHPFYETAFALQIFFYTLAFAGYLQKNKQQLGRLFYIPYYFCLVNWASLQGILENYAGKKYAVWSTVREN